MSDKQDVGFFDVGTDEDPRTPDLLIENGDLKADNGLETAALITLFSDRFVELENLPTNVTDQQGWWADLISTPLNDLIGSNLWLSDASGKITDELINHIDDGLKEAFNWMIEDGVADTIETEVSRVGTYQLYFSVNIYRPNGDNIPLKFIWDAQELKRIRSVS